MRRTYFVFFQLKEVLWFWCQRYHKLPKLLDLVVLLSNLILTSGSDCTWGKRPWSIALGEIWWTPVDVDNQQLLRKIIAQIVSRILSISCIVVYIYMYSIWFKKESDSFFPKSHHPVLPRKLQESSGLDIAYQVFYWTVKSFVVVGPFTVFRVVDKNNNWWTAGFHGMGSKYDRGS